jgi:hypothetical protein
MLFKILIFPPHRNCCEVSARRKPHHFFKNNVLKEKVPPLLYSVVASYSRIPGSQPQLCFLVRILATFRTISTVQLKANTTLLADLWILYILQNSLSCFHSYSKIFQFGTVQALHILQQGLGCFQCTRFVGHYRQGLSTTAVRFEDDSGTTSSQAVFLFYLDLVGCQGLHCLQ